MSYSTDTARSWSHPTHCKTAAASPSKYPVPDKFSVRAHATVSVSSIAWWLYYLAGLPMTLHSKLGNYKHWQEILQQQMLLKNGKDVKKFNGDLSFDILKARGQGRNQWGQERVWVRSQWQMRLMLKWAWINIPCLSIYRRSWRSHPGNKDTFSLGGKKWDVKRLYDPIWTGS